MTHPEIDPAETAEQFQARYPRPSASKGFRRVLVRCSCDFLAFDHWGWGWWDFAYPDGDLGHNEELAEPRPVALPEG